MSFNEVDCTLQVQACHSWNNVASFWLEVEADRAWDGWMDKRVFWMRLLTGKQVLDELVYAKCEGNCVGIKAFAMIARRNALRIP